MEGEHLVRVLTVCKITESVASTVLKFSGGRSRQRDDDSKAKSKVVNKCVMTPQYIKFADSQDIQGYVYVLQSGQYFRSQAAHDRVTEHDGHVHTTN